MFFLYELSFACIMKEGSLVKDLRFFKNCFIMYKVLSFMGDLLISFGSSVARTIETRM